MEFLTMIGASIITKMFEYTIEPVGRRLIYLYCFERNMEILNNQKRELEARKSAVEQLVEDAERKGEEIEDKVQAWLSKVDDLLKNPEIAGLLSDEIGAGARCSMSQIFPNPILRYRLSRKAEKNAPTVNKILLEGTFERVSRCPAIVNQGYMAFETRILVFQGIMGALKEAGVTIIGMYGLGGIGKTMLAKEIARKARQERLFSKVIMVTVSQTRDVDRIQREIAKELHLQFSHDSTQSTRAYELRQKLSEEKNILIILDDIWGEIDLLEFGLHFGDHQNQCKILLTSRSSERQNFMCVDKSFMVEALSKKEAMDLFSKYIGALDDRDPDNPKPLSTEIVEECAGLPVAITTLACALKGKASAVWKNALNELKNSSPTNISGMNEKVYASIKMSYNFLESEEAKSLLLLCSMHGEDDYISVGKLLMYSVGWGFLEDIETLEQARDRVYTLIDKLKANCLLLPADRERKYLGDGVQMHDVVRDVMISVASKDKHMFTIASTTKFAEWIHKEKLEASTAISLLDEIQFSGLPSRLACRQLRLFLTFPHFRGPISSFNLPVHFFEETEKLGVLQLNCLSLPSCPSPFSSLKNLQTLCLNNCNMEDTAFIGGLKNLKILDLSGSAFHKLSEQIGQLTRLQHLDLSQCFLLKVIEPCVISSLIQLEELNMEGFRIGWEDERVNIERRNASLTELKHLPKLQALYVDIQEASLVAKDVFSENLKRYDIRIGEIPVPRCPKSTRCLQLDLPKSSMLDDFGLEKPLKRSEELHLSGFEGITNNICQLDVDGFPQLKRLEFENNAEVQFVVNASIRIAFRNLEYLSLHNLTNLRKICEGKLTADSFSKIEVIFVETCDGLKNIFPFSDSIVGKLEEVTVKQCKSMEQIFFCERGDVVQKCEFPRLRSLTLEALPKLASWFWLETAETTHSSSSQQDTAPSLPFFDDKVSLPSLEDLDLGGLNLTRIWIDQPASEVHYMQNLKSLTIDGCDCLNYLLSFAAAGNFLQLEYLCIRSCKDMEEVIGMKETAGQERRPEKIILFPQLNKLDLDRLPNLKRFCGGTSLIEFPSLMRLEIIGCPKLTTFMEDYSISTQDQLEEIGRLLFNEKVSLPSLEDLDLGGLNLTRIWIDQPASDVHYMQNLKSLTIDGCDCLNYLLSFAAAGNFVQLEYLCIAGCRGMEEVIVMKEPAGQERRPKIILFPQLNKLDLDRLSNLKRFCGGASLIEFPSLTLLGIEDCPKLTTLVGDYSISTQDQLEETEQLLFNEKVAIPRLSDLLVKNCGSVKYVTSYDTAKSHLKLINCLHIFSCDIMEEVVLVEKERVDNAGRLMEDDDFLFSKLKYLRLFHLPKLQQFAPLDCIQHCPSSIDLYIDDCPRFGTADWGSKKLQLLQLCEMAYSRKLEQ